MKDLVMVGAGKFAEACVYLFELENKILQYYDSPREEGETKHGIPVSMELPQLEKLRFISCIGNTRQRRFMIEQIKLPPKVESFNWLNVIHDDTTINYRTVYMGGGNLIQDGVIIRPFAQIGSHNLICGQSNLGHHSKTGDYCTFGPKAVICGNVTVGDGVFLGAGSIVKPNRKIGEGAIIGAGAVVSKNVPPNHVLDGNPPIHIRTEDRW